MHGKAANLTALCVLQRFTPEDETPQRRAVEVTRLSPVEAFSALLPHAYCFTLSDAQRKGLMMKQYMSLVASVPVYKVSFRTGLQHLPAILDEIEQAVECSSRAEVC
jgi:hypothetical protein